MKRGVAPKRAIPAAAPPDPTLEALRLLGLWTRLAQGHISLSAAQGCLCGAAFGSVQVIDFERDIIDFLRGRHALASALLTDETTVNALLRELARAKATIELPVAVRSALLVDLATSIGSFEA